MGYEVDRSFVVGKEAQPTQEKINGVTFTWMDTHIITKSLTYTGIYISAIKNKNLQSIYKRFLYIGYIITQNKVKLFWISGSKT